MPNKTVYILGQEHLAKSKNLAIKALVDDDFYIIPQTFSPILAADANRTLEIKIGNETINSSSFNAASDAKEEKKPSIQEKFNNIFTQKVTRAGRDSETLKTRLNNAYSQYSLYHLRFSLDQAIKETLNKETIHAGSALGLLGHLPVEPQKYSSRITIPVGKQKTENVKLDVVGTNFVVRECSSKANVLVLEGTIRLEAELVEVEAEQLKQILRKRKIHALQVYLDSFAYKSIQVSNPKQAQEYVDNMQFEIASIATTQYPTHLFHVKKVVTDSVVLRDVLLSKVLPDLTQKKYKTAVSIPTLEDQKESYKCLYKERLDEQPEADARKEINDNGETMHAYAVPCRQALMAVCKKQTPPKKGSYGKSLLWAALGAVCAAATIASTFLAVATGGLFVPLAAGCGALTAFCLKKSVNEYQGFEATVRYHQVLKADARNKAAEKAAENARLAEYAESQNRLAEKRRQNLLDGQAQREATLERKSPSSDSPRATTPPIELPGAVLPATPEHKPSFQSPALIQARLASDSCADDLSYIPEHKLENNTEAGFFERTDNTEAGFFERTDGIDAREARTGRSIIAKPEDQLDERPQNKNMMNM